MELEAQAPPHLYLANSYSSCGLLKCLLLQEDLPNPQQGQTSNPLLCFQSHPTHALSTCYVPGTVLTSQSALPRLPLPL